MTRRPRILLINYEYPPLGGGAGTATAAMARALAGLGCDVAVLTSRFRGQPATARTDGFTVHRVRVLRRRPDRCTPFEMFTFMVSAGAAALPLARRWRPDRTIAFFGIPGGPVAWLVRLAAGTPYIVSLRGGDVPGFDWGPGAAAYHRVAAPVIRFVWRRAAAVVANGSGLRRLAEAALPGLAVAVVPNGVDVPEDLDGAAHATARTASDGAPVRLLLVGRLAHQKGIDVLIPALGRLRHLPFTLDVVGDGPDRRMLEHLADRNGLAGRVRFAGWTPRDNMPGVYRDADVFVFPSRAEGMPNAVLEAMSHGLPVVATAVPGNTDLIVHERTGLLVAPEDETQLAAALERMLSDVALRRRLGAAARAHVLANHSWTAAAAAYLRLAGVAAPAHDVDNARPAAEVH